MATPNADTTGADLCEDPGAYYVNYHRSAFRARPEQWRAWGAATGSSMSH
ncbi:MAG TPA: hypothetical protein VLB79_02845 [Solirubrobacterales bacterium]|nr:hypothetical protein [Solirubrobacterales bacterium]